MHAKCVMKLMYLFSRIAKTLGGVCCVVAVAHVVQYLYIEIYMWYGTCHMWHMWWHKFDWLRRPHIPRDRAIRDLYEYAGLTVPGLEVRLCDLGPMMLGSLCVRACLRSM